MQTRVSVAQSVSGALLYDNVTIKIADAALSDFAFFKSEGSLAGVSSASRGMAESGPSRHKSAVHPVSFASSLASRDWTAPDEKLLRKRSG